jgi:hypothetical protein
MRARRNTEQQHSKRLNELDDVAKVQGKQYFEIKTPRILASAKRLLQVGLFD